MAAYLAPLCYIATGLGFALFLAVNLMSSKVVRAWPGRWFGMAMLVAPVGFLLLAKALDGPSGTQASQFVAGAVAVFFISSILIGVGLVATARRLRSEGANP